MKPLFEADIATFRADIATFRADTTASSFSSSQSCRGF
jgi:hypothetical protein